MTLLFAPDSSASLPAESSVGQTAPWPETLESSAMRMQSEACADHPQGPQAASNVAAAWAIQPAARSASSDVIWRESVRG